MILKRITYRGKYEQEIVKLFLVTDAGYREVKLVSELMQLPEIIKVENAYEMKGKLLFEEEGK